MKIKNKIEKIYSGEAAWVAIESWLSEVDGPEGLLSGLLKARKDYLYVATFEKPIPDISGKVGESSMYFQAFTPEEYEHRIKWLPAMVTPEEWYEHADFLVTGNYSCDPDDIEPACATDECLAFIGMFRRLWLTKWAQTATWNISPLEGGVIFVEGEGGRLSLSITKAHVRDGGLPFKKVEYGLDAARYRIYCCCLDAAAQLGLIRNITPSMN